MGSTRGGGSFGPARLRACLLTKRPMSAFCAGGGGGAGRLPPQPETASPKQTPSNSPAVTNVVEDMSHLLFCHMLVPQGNPHRNLETRWARAFRICPLHAGQTRRLYGLPSFERPAARGALRLVLAKLRPASQANAGAFVVGILLAAFGLHLLQERGGALGLRPRHLQL